MTWVQFTNWTAFHPTGPQTGYHFNTREEPSVSKLQTMRAVKPRLVKTTRFVKKTTSRIESTDSKLDNALRETYIPYLFGQYENLDPTVKALVYTLPTHKLAERAVAKMFELELPSDNTHGYDLDTTGLEWDGVDYGKIEIRSRSLSYYWKPAPVKDDPWREVQQSRFCFANQQEMNRKRDNGSANWFFCVGYDDNSKKLVWFRFPARLVFSKSVLIVSRGVGGGYGWADSYLWDGPENEEK